MTATEPRHTVPDLVQAIALTADTTRLLMGSQSLNLDFDRLSSVIAHTNGKARRTYYRRLGQELAK